MFHKDGYVHTEVNGGMHGFPQAVMLAHKDLVTRLTAHGCKPTPFTPGLLTHKTNVISFSLLVEDFGV